MFTEDNDVSYEKYIEMKRKYLNLKNQLGGESVQEILDRYNGGAESLKAQEQVQEQTASELAPVTIQEQVQEQTASELAPATIQEQVQEQTEEILTHKLEPVQKLATEPVSTLHQIIGPGKVSNNEETYKTYPIIGPGNILVGGEYDSDSDIDTLNW